MQTHTPYELKPHFSSQFHVEALNEGSHLKGQRARLSMTHTDRDTHRHCEHTREFTSSYTT